MRNRGIRTAAALAFLVVGALSGPPAASAGELYKDTKFAIDDTWGSSNAIVASLKPGGQSFLESTDGKTIVDTCTGTQLGWIIDFAGGAFSHPTGKVNVFTFSNCSHTTDVLANGSIEVQRIGGTRNGTVISKGMEVTLQSTTFGISCVASTGGGTVLGTLVGSPAASENHAEISVNGAIPASFVCGGDFRWTTTYTVTSPTGLYIE